MFIRSPRLFLRPAWPEDWREVYEAVRDERVVRNLATVPWPYTEEDARSFTALPQGLRHPRFLVTLPGAHGSEVIGCVSLLAEDGGTGIGYWIAPHRWGCGYAAEAASALLGLAPRLGHRRITAWRFADNPASGRVLERIGFRPSGRREPRFSLGRGASAMAVHYAIDLGSMRQIPEDEAPERKRAA
jgi:RimJ/RimL family protein N-acetyltransferase